MSQIPCIRFTIEDEEGYEVEHTLPAHYVVCYRCEGSGSHVNPAIDGSGLTREDFDADPDFMEDYMSGAYDVRCEECHGRRVVPETIPEEGMSPEQVAVLRLYEAYLDAEYAYRAEAEAERRMGA